MLRIRAGVIFVALWTAIGYADQNASGDLSNAEQVLRSSTDGEALERAAITLAVSEKESPIVLLGQMLRDPAFLTRLQGADHAKTRHLSRVLQALAEHPTPQVAELFRSLAEDPAFVAADDRKSIVLELLAHEKPMAEQTAAVIERSNEEGYFAFNARLLADNSSPRALELFQSMMLDQTVSAESRVQCLHQAIVPRRMQLAVLRAAAHILARTRERAIARGVAESLFEYRQNWFSIESGISEPAAWPTASSELLHAASSVADAALARHDIDHELREKIVAIRIGMARTLAAREK